MPKASEPAIKPQKSVDMNVLDTIQGKLPSQKQQANIIDIIKSSIEKRKLGIPFDSFAKVLSDKLQDKNNSIIQIDNSAFFVQRNPSDPNRVNFAIFSIDNPNGLSKSISGFNKFLKNQGISYAETYDELQEVVQAFDNAGFKSKLEKTMDKRGNKMVPSYKISFGVKQ